MNPFQLILKQMRQRALSTWLTLLSVTLGVALAAAITILGRESQAMFGQNDYGYDILVGKKGSKLQLTLNTVYNLDVSPGNIPFSAYTQFFEPGDPTAGHYGGLTRIAVPIVRGDTLNGKYPIIGTLPKMFGFDDADITKRLPENQTIKYRPDRMFDIPEGRVFHARKFEAMIGSDIPALTGLHIGSVFQATHGTPLPTEVADVHDEKWTVVGILAPTHTASDSVVYIPLVSFYTIAEHGIGLLKQEAIREGRSDTSQEKAQEEEKKHYTMNPDGTIQLDLPPDVWALSAILVQSRGGVTMQSLLYYINNGTDVMACNPATEMRDFFDTFLKPIQTMLLMICWLVTVVAAIGILVSIYNSISGRMREIAILRALGATRQTILGLICAEAGLIGLAGAVLGIVMGHGLSGVGSVFMTRKFGEGINWVRPDASEGIYLLVVVVLAVLAGLAPAMKAYRTPVATNLVAE